MKYHRFAPGAVENARLVGITMLGEGSPRYDARVAGWRFVVLLFVPQIRAFTKVHTACAQSLKASRAVPGKNR